MAHIRPIYPLDMAKNQIEDEIAKALGHNKIIISRGLQFPMGQKGIANWDIDWALNGSAPSGIEFPLVNALIEKLRHDFDIAN